MRGEIQTSVEFKSVCLPVPKLELSRTFKKTKWKKATPDRRNRGQLELHRKSCMNNAGNAMSREICARHASMEEEHIRWAWYTISGSTPETLEKPTTTL